MLKAFLASLPGGSARRSFAQNCGTSLGHLRNCISSGKPIAEKTCVLIEQHSAQRVMRWHLRDDWREIWPELVTRSDAPIVADQHQTVYDADANLPIGTPVQQLEAAGRATGDCHAA